MEEEAAALRDMQAKVEKEMGVVQGLTPSPMQFTILFSVNILNVRFWKG